jgi:hypothetical protein
MMNFTRTPNASETVIGSRSIGTIKLKFIAHSQNAAATKLPFLAELFLTVSVEFRRDKRVGGNRSTKSKPIPGPHVV